MWKVSCQSWWWSSHHLNTIPTTSSISLLSSSLSSRQKLLSEFHPRSSSSSSASAKVRNWSWSVFNSQLKSTSGLSNIYWNKFHSFPLQYSLNCMSHCRLLNNLSSLKLKVTKNCGGLNLIQNCDKLLLTNIKNYSYTRTSYFVTSSVTSVKSTTTTPTPSVKVTSEGVGRKVKFGGERRLTSSYPIPAPGKENLTSSQIILDVVGRQVVRNETLWRQELRAWDRGRGTGFESTMVAMGTSLFPGSSPRSRISTTEIASIAQEFLGQDRFSTKSSLSHNFGPFQDIISLFLFKVAHIDHPLLYITKIVEAEPSQSLKENVKNPYPLWRAMMILLVTEMCGFSQDLVDAPDEVIQAIRDKHDKVAKIAEVSWVAHQLHRRILDISETPRLSSLNSSSSKSPTEEIDLHKSNKAATLVGDLLLTQMCAHMAALKSPLVTELVCTALSDYCESEFELGVKPCPARQFNYDSWLRRSEQDLGSLLGHCLYSALLFSGFDTATLNRAFKLGSLLGILYQAYDDISFFNREELTNPNWLDVGILPVVYQIQRNPEFLTKSHTEIFQAIKSPTNPVMAQSMGTFLFLKDHVLKELTSYNDVESITARDILINFIHSMNPIESTSI